MNIIYVEMIAQLWIINVSKTFSAGSQGATYEN